MSYGDECTRSRDIDSLESKTRDLDFDISRLKDDLQRSIDRLEEKVAYLQERINLLESEGKGA